MITLHFFDFDQTLFETKNAIYKSYKYALKGWSYDLTEQKFEDLYMDSESFLANEGFDEETIKAIRLKKNNIYLEKYYKEINPLQVQGIKKNYNDKFIIVSNTTTNTINTILERFNLRNFFDDVIGVDTDISLKRKHQDFSLYHYAYKKHLLALLTNDFKVIVYEDDEHGTWSAYAAMKEYNLWHNDRIKDFQIKFKPFVK